MITFKDVMPWIISGLSLFFAWWTNTKKDTKDSTVIIATVTQQLKNLENGQAEMNRMLRDLTSESRDHEERLIKLEMMYEKLEETINEKLRG